MSAGASPTVAFAIDSRPAEEGRDRVVRAFSDIQSGAQSAAAGIGQAANATDRLAESARRVAPPAVTYRRVINDVEQGQRGAASTAQSLVYSFNGLAASSLGVSQSFGTLFANLAPFMGLGAAGTAGVLVGVTVMARAWDAYSGAADRAGKASKEAAEKIQKSIDDLVNSGSFEALEKKYREATLGTRAAGGQDGLTALREERARLFNERQQLLDALKNAPAGSFGAGSAVQANPRIDALTKQIDELDRSKIAPKVDEVNKLFAALFDPRNGQEFAERGLGPVVVTAKSLTGEYKAHKKELDEIAKTIERYDAGLKRIADQEERAQAADRRRAAVALSDPSLDKSIAADLAEVGKQRRAFEASINEDAQQALGIMSTALLQSFDQTLDELAGGPFYRRVANGLADAVAQGVLRGLESGTLGGEAFWSSIAQLGEQLVGDALQRALSKASKSDVGKFGGAALAGGFVGYSIGTATGNSAQGFVGGAVGGALAGGSVGGVPGAIIGGAIGAIAGLAGAHKKAQEVAEAMVRAQQAYVASFASFDRAMRGTGTALDDAQAAIHATADKLRQDAADAYKGSAFRDNASLIAAKQAQVTSAEAAGLQRNALEFAQSKFDFFEQQRAEQLRLGGLGDEADAIERQIANTKELNDAIKQYGEDVRDSVLATQAARDAAREKAAAEAAAAAREQAYEDERAREFQRGADAAANATRDKQAADAERERVASLEAYNRTSREDLKVRQLVAQGRTAEADAMRDQLTVQRALEEAIKGGADAMTQAEIIYTNALEAQAAATQKAADAAKRAAQAEASLASSRLDLLAQRNGALGIDPTLGLQQQAALAMLNGNAAHALDGTNTADPASLTAAIDAWLKEALDPARLGQADQDTLNDLRDTASTLLNLRDAAKKLGGNAGLAGFQAAGGLSVKHTDTVKDSVASAFTGFSVSQANESNGLARTANAYLSRIADNTGALKFFEGFTGGWTGTLTVVVKADRGTGRDADQIVDKLDRRLNGRLRFQERAGGRTTVN
ncbi:hypothetical protein J421_4657 (plasmid) [Gemmatirosa kalamazoonensis]|uniref:Uncharacterized protein n=1 Tax=Gemmatirosa kalamazoonensis TaxID=861299 RepID=W0RM19_9BACT|nr:hypothetical protein [Gemmatirosa kalamazoonensis]AHG92124.1 hypothetical protein J421_4589 [Gemmatirosa kalamazoonensis]AHG92192.1 hypothetical protein J421_4657 [Gemmatirosa kalamazoonensis]